MFQLIVEKGFPTRVNRWCCKLLKECNGEGRFMVTGIRWAESARRSKRKMTEVCNKKTGGRYLHPIIDWTTKEVWEYLNSLHLVRNIFL